MDLEKHILGAPNHFCTHSSYSSCPILKELPGMSNSPCLCAVSRTKRSEAGGNIVLSVTVLHSTRYQKYADGEGASQVYYMELEASLWESLSVMNQICKANEHTVCPVRRGYSVCSISIIKHKIYLYFYLDGAQGEKMFFRIPDIVGTDMK